MLFWLFEGQLAYGQMLTADLELKLVPNVGSAWQTIQLENSYSDAVIVCTYNLPSDTDPPALTRVQNVTATSFQLKIQRFVNSSTVTPSNVHCIIADEGAYDVAGLKFEAHTVLSTDTNKKSVWQSNRTEDVTSSILQNYAAPVTIGQIMSNNDANASVFWAHNCNNRGVPAFQGTNNICVGKHTSKTDNTRANETLGYMVIESGTGTLNDVTFAAALGSNSIRGVGNNPAYNYSVTGDFDIGVATQAAENGGDGSWAVLYGADPLASNIISLAVDEDDVVNSTNRSHIDEQVGYWVFDNNQTPTMNANKDVAMFSGNTSAYAVPGSDVVYSISVDNSGSGPVDTNSIIMIDAMPPELSFMTGSVTFIDNDSGLTFDPALDVAFSKAATAPANFAACTDTPSGTYDPDITFICLAPKGTMSEGTITPSSFTIEFQAAVK